MAFEYLLAHYLLTSDMKGFASLATRLKDFYRDLPTHVQEALLGYRNVNGSLPPGIDRSAIQSEIETRFATFVYVWTRIQNGPISNYDRSTIGPFPFWERAGAAETPHEQKI